MDTDDAGNACTGPFTRRSSPTPHIPHYANIEGQLRGSRPRNRFWPHAEMYPLLSLGYRRDADLIPNDGPLIPGCPKGRRVHSGCMNGFAVEKAEKEEGPSARGRTRSRTDELTDLLGCIRRPARDTSLEPLHLLIRCPWPSKGTFELICLRVGQTCAEVVGEGIAKLVRDSPRLTAPPR